MKEELSQLREKVSKAPNGKVDAASVAEALAKAEETLKVLMFVYYLSIILDIYYNFLISVL